MTLWALIPFDGEVDHGVGHWSLALPVLLLGGLVLFAWPPLAPGRTAQVVRWALIIGLAIFGFGQLVEGLGAFGYREDGLSPANDLVKVHALGVGMTATGFMPLLAGLIMTGGVVMADRRGGLDQRFCPGRSWRRWQQWSSSRSAASSSATEAPRRTTEPMVQG